MIDYEAIKDKKIALLLSGGVDSSVVLYEMVSLRIIFLEVQNYEDIETALCESSGRPYRH